MHCFLKKFLITTAILATPVFAADTWVQSGMGGGGGIEQPSISPHDPNTVFLSSDMSGVYKTTDFGTQWEMLPYRTEGQNGINDRGGTSPFQFTNDPNIIYATNRSTHHSWVDGERVDHIVYPVKSTDGGQTFSKMAADYSIRIFADPSNSDRVLIHTESEIQYSNDGGDTFTSINGLVVPTDTILDDRGNESSVRILHLAGVNWTDTSVVVATNFGLLEFDPTATGSDLAFSSRGNTDIFRGIENSIATFSSVTLPSVGDEYRAKFYIVTYPISVSWGLSYPRQPYNFTANEGAKSSDNVKVYSMDWVKGAAPMAVPEAEWKQITSYPSDFVPYWVKTSASDPNVVYLGGVDKTPWPRPALMRSANQGGVPGSDQTSDWQSIFQIDNCNDNGVCTEFNLNIQPGWLAAGALIDRNFGGMDWGWSASIEGLAVDPNDAERVMLTTSSIYVTEKASEGSWKQAFGTQAEQNPANVIIPSYKSEKRYSTNGMEPTMTYWLTWSDDKMIAAMTDVFGMLSDDNGYSWRNLANSMRNARVLTDLGNGNTHLGYVALSNFYKISKSKLDDKRLYAAAATINDIYQADDRLVKFEKDNSTLQSCLASHPKSVVNGVVVENGGLGATGSIYKSNDNGQSWDHVQWFDCPVVWVEPTLETVNGAQTEVLYISVVHSQYGGIYKVENPDSDNPVISQLSNPSATEGNPYNIYSLNSDGSEVVLLTNWAVKLDDTGTDTTPGNPVGSGMFKYVNGVWESMTQPLAMDTNTRNIVIDPKDDTMWYAAAFNKYDKFQEPPKSNAVADGGGGIFRFTNNGASYVRITPESMYRAESITINPNPNSSEAYVTTAYDGLWKTDDVYADSPVFTRITSFPYGRTLRVFYAPDNTVWVTTFGGGLWKLNDDGSSVSVGTIDAIVTVPSGTGSADPITDGVIDKNNFWSNGGKKAKRYIELDLQASHSISNIFYADVGRKRLKVTIFNGDSKVKVLRLRMDPKADGISQTNIAIDNVIGDRIRIDVVAGKWMKTVEANVQGIKVEADFSSITTLPETNPSKVSNLSDGDLTGDSWHNGGDANVSLQLSLDKTRLISSIRYTDAWIRTLKLEFYKGSELVHTFNKKTTNGKGKLVTTSIAVPNISADRIIIKQANTNGVKWLAPTEIDVLGLPE